MPNIKPRIRTVVKCPYCQYEHELAEVIDPENLTGCAKPSNVIRDPTNTNIIYEEWEEGKEPLTELTYECDKCHKTFVAKFDIKVKTESPAEEVDFDNNSVSLFD